MQLTPQASRFLLTWFSAVLILVGFALITDIDWLKPKIEQITEDAIHRRVFFGHLTWSFGLNGLFFNPTRFLVKKQSGTTFLQAGPSEIGIAFVPLFSGKLVIRHVHF